MTGKQKFCLTHGAIFVKSTFLTTSSLLIISTEPILTAISVVNSIKTSIIQHIQVWKLILHGVTFYVLMKPVKRSVTYLLGLKMNFKLTLTLNIGLRIGHR